MNKLFTALFFVSILLSSYIKISSVAGNNFAFTIDQGRDLVDVRHMVVFQSPRLVGPTTSINGVLLGPFYYYFITIPFILFGGSPAAIVYWQIFWFQLSVIVLWLVLKQKSKLLADITSTLLLLSPMGFYTARYFWNANAMPIFVILFVALLLKSIWSTKQIWLILLGLLIGFSLQVEAAFGVIFVPFSVIFLLLNRKTLKNLLALLFSFLLTIVPQILFEFRHSFVMSKTLFAGLSGSSDILGKKLLFAQKFIQRGQVYAGAIRETNHIQNNFLLYLFVISLLVLLLLIIKKKVSNLVVQSLFLSLGFLATSFVFYLIFSQNLKSWYTLGLPVFFIFLTATFLYQIAIGSKWGKTLSALVIVFSFYAVSTNYSKYLKTIKVNPSDDPSSLSNQIKAMEYVYKEANGKNFKVYVYLPSVIDYTYQYLFWWYGKKTYGYMPSDLTYLPDQPDYIEDMKLFHTPQREKSSADPVFMIVEKGENEKLYLNWLNSFGKYNLKSATTYNISPKLFVLRIK